MPTLTRLVVGASVLVAIGFAAFYSLATFVEPHPREMQIRIPEARLSGK